MYAWMVPSQTLHTVSIASALQFAKAVLWLQVMYAYVMRPETLPASYWKFIVKSGPVEAPALEAVRRSIRKLPIDLQAFNAFLKKRGSAALLATAFPKQVQPYLVHGWEGGGGGGAGVTTVNDSVLFCMGNAHVMHEGWAYSHLG